MTDVSLTEALSAGPLPGERLDQLAASALHEVANRQRRTASIIDPQLVEELQAAVVSGSGTAGLTVVRRMVGSGIRPEDVADHYIPAVAQRLGDMWCEDDMGFATVTIGTARLQALLRDLEDMAGVPRMTEPDGAAIMVVVASGLYHTLGAMVLTGQLRRRGHAVRLMLGAEPEAVAVSVRQARFDAVMISSASGTPAEIVRRLVSAIKKATGAPPPVVIGGTVVESVAGTGEDLLALTGADHATSDPDEALRLCGLTLEVVADRGQGF